MKKSISFSFAAFFFFLPSITAQPRQGFVPTKGRYTAWIRLKNDLNLYQGVIEGTSDQSIAINPKVPDMPDVFSFTEIESIFTQRKGNIGRGIAIGALLGGITGFAIAKLSGEAYQEGIDSAGDAVGGVTIGLLLGGVIGAAVGNGKKKITLKDEMDILEFRSRISQH